MSDNKVVKRMPFVKNNCIGCGACVAIASEVFEFDNNTGLSVANIKELYNEQDVNNAISACPVDAIIWKEENSEKQFSGKVEIKKPFVNNSCIGCGACVAIASEVFEFGEELPVTVLELSNYENKGVNDAISACPVGAISWK